MGKLSPRDALAEEIRMQMAVHKEPNKELAKRLGISVPSFRLRRENPALFTLYEIKVLHQILGIDLELVAAACNGKVV